MKRVLLISLLLVVALPLYLCAVEKNVVHQSELKPVLDNGDFFPVANSRVQQIFEAREHGDVELHEALIEEWKQTLPGQPNDAPTPHAEKVEGQSAPAMRWGDDIVLWSGTVFYNSWAMLLGVDDEAISVDCHVGDTLIAAVARPESTVAVLRSYDQGMSWTHVWTLSLTAEQLFEPEVIYGPDGHYHIFMKTTYNNGTLIVFNFDALGNWTAPWIATAADTIVSFTVCSDRTDYFGNYYLFMAYHKQLGGMSNDQIDFLRSFDQGETWEAPATIQGAGSAAPDFSWGNSGYLYSTYSWWNGNNKGVNTRRSSNGGNAWFGSVQVYGDGDSVNVMGPQIACSHDGTQDAWVLFARQDPYTDSLDYGMGWTWSTDAGATWSTWGYVHSWADYSEVLPSISVHDGYHDSLYAPYVTFIRSVYDWTDPYTLTFFWDSGAWSTPAESYNDFVPEFTRPIQTYQIPGIPAMAYVGSGGNNVYYDAWGVGVEEESPATKEISLGKAHPNPFSTRTRIELTLPRSSTVTVKAYNIIGQEVATIFNGTKHAGTHSIEWKGIGNDGNRLPSGIYFMRIKTPYHTSSKKLILQ